MTDPITIPVPDIGDFSDIPVIDVLVAPGDRVEVETPLVTLESDKATMDVPSPHAGTVESVLVAVGDTVSEGAPLVTVAPEHTSSGREAAEAGPDNNLDNDSVAGAGTPPRNATESDTGGDGADRDHPNPPAAPTTIVSATEAPTTPTAPEAPATIAPATTGSADIEADIEAEVVVLGAGPGGYTAAFRAADLGLRTVLVERYPTLGGVCLNVGCIPSKALLHAAAVIDGAGEMAAHGIDFGSPSIDIAKLAGWKNKVVGRLTHGLAGLAKQRKVQVVQGAGTFSAPHRLRVETPEGTREIAFERAIIAAGSQAVALAGFPNDDPRLMDSTDALGLDEVPERLLVIGGGIIGLEMATVYAALGSRVSVVELMDGLIPGCDRDLVKPLEKRIRARYEAIRVSTRVTAVSPEDSGLRVTFEGANGDGRSEEVYDRVLVAVGRRPNGHRIGAENAGVHVDERGFIPADRQQRTNVDHIFAIGDIAGEPMLAHKATHEGKVAAEVCAGHKASFDALTIPSVAYTDPEVAWTGLTETEAREQGIEFDKATFPWAASGRALGVGRTEGLTKVLFDRDTGRLLGAGIVGPHAGDLIAEATLAIEMGADARDIGLTIHPHPTLSETFNFAAEMVEGTITDLYVPRRGR
ncbi:MAG: dihydrolipoyl dehydrogenase [Thiotrichales bacterium]|nr:dihydrolipoyl dehydrogenase [Thiotrichales bacterium]